MPAHIHVLLHRSCFGPPSGEGLIPERSRKVSDLSVKEKEKLTLLGVEREPLKVWGVVHVWGDGGRGSAAGGKAPWFTFGRGGRGSASQKTPSLHRLGGGVQQEFEHSFLGTENPSVFLRIG